MRRLGRWAACSGLITAALASALAPGPRVAADGGSCRRVDCSGHGTCMTERDRPFCLCDDGFAATGLSCAPVREPDTGARRRSALTQGRIVHVAIAEAGRGPFQVGGERTTAPFPLGRYVQPREMWCSDFVSWVYRAAGVPFTGGYAGGWLLTNNFAIRRWFQRRGLWVDRDSRQWAAFQPMPGDYVRMHTRSGNGHSGIVRYVAGDTLYTVEGNVGSRVRLRRYARFRDQPRIDGFGLVTMTEARARARSNEARPR